MANTALSLVVIPTCLSIAGYDQSGGAGIVSDAKTFDAHGCIGLTVQSAYTLQSENEIKKLRWEPIDQIVEQLEILAKSRSVFGVKIGLIEDESNLQRTVSEVRRLWPEVSIVWDPIIAASCAFEFREQWKVDPSVVQGIDVITPNIVEMQSIAYAMECDWQESAASIADSGVSVCVTGVLERGGEIGNLLFTNRAESMRISVKVLDQSCLKHGSGCIFSSSLVCALAKGETITDAAAAATSYVGEYMLSTRELLGVHSLRHKQNDSITTLSH